MKRQAIDDLDKKIIHLLQGDIHLDARPFAVMAEEIGMPEEEFLAKAQALKDRGIMRRFGATLRHQEAGFGANAMVAWLVPEDQVEEKGRVLASFREVTHCYQRTTHKDWPYNLYTMIHAPTREQCVRVAEKMAAATGLTRFAQLFSEREFKKTSMRYF